MSLITYGVLLYGIPLWFKMKQEDEATELIEREVENNDKDVEEVKESETNGTNEDS